MFKYYYGLLLDFASDHSCCQRLFTECDSWNLLLIIVVRCVDNTFGLCQFSAKYVYHCNNSALRQLLCGIRIVGIRRLKLKSNRELEKHHSAIAIIHVVQWAKRHQFRQRHCHCRLYCTLITVFPCLYVLYQLNYNLPTSEC